VKPDFNLTAAARALKVEFQPVATQSFVRNTKYLHLRHAQLNPLVVGENMTRLSDWYSHQLAQLKTTWSNLREVIIEEESKLRREELLREIRAKQPQE
jgi:hypothetical protein